MTPVDPDGPEITALRAENERLRNRLRYWTAEDTALARAVHDAESQLAVRDRALDAAHAVEPDAVDSLLAECERRMRNVERDGGCRLNAAITCNGVVRWLVDGERRVC